MKPNTFQIDSPWGPLYLETCSEGMVRVQTSHGNGQGQPITVNRVDYFISAFLIRAGNRWIWDPQRQGSRLSGWRARQPGKKLSDSARDTLTTRLPGVVHDWVTRNLPLLSQALANTDQKVRERRIHGMRREIEQHQLEIRKLETQINTLQTWEPGQPLPSHAH